MNKLDLILNLSKHVRFRQEHPKNKTNLQIVEKYVEGLSATKSSKDLENLIEIILSRDVLSESTAKYFLSLEIYQGIPDDSPNLLTIF